jgi:hypothetical protein
VRKKLREPKEERLLAIRKGVNNMNRDFPSLVVAIVAATGPASPCFILPILAFPLQTYYDSELEFTNSMSWRKR